MARITEIIVEPSTIYVTDKFKLKVKVEETPMLTGKIITEYGIDIITENNDNIVTEGE